MKLFSHSTGRLVLITVTVAILLSLGSCSKNKKAVYNLEGTMILDVKQSTDQELINPTVYTNAEGVITVLCGYGFEDFDEKLKGNGILILGDNEKAVGGTWKKLNSVSVNSYIK